MNDEFKIIRSNGKLGDIESGYKKEIEIKNPKSISHVTKKLMKIEKIRNEFFPKIYKSTKTHYCPMECSTTLFGVLANDKASHNQEVCNKVHSERKKYNFPTFFVEPDLLKMIQMTQIKQGLSLEDIKWPLNSMLFAFPKRHYLAGTYNKNMVYAQGVYVSRTFDIQTLQMQMRASKEGKNSDDYRLYDSELSDDFSAILDAEEFSQSDYDKAIKKYEPIYGNGLKIIESIGMVVPLSDGSVCTMSYPINGDFMETLRIYKNIYTYEDIDGNITTEDEFKQSPDEYTLMGRLPDGSLIEDETTMMQDVALNAIKLVVYMASRKAEWTATETKCGVVKGRRFGKSTMWTPNFLGKQYSGYIDQQERKSENKNGKKLKFHWRLGYHGIRWHGKGRTQKKIVWVLPYKVNEDNK
jgi:hypothetical protein